jgi:hypothetical protein
LARLHDAYMEIPAFQDALPENQPDAPSSWKITSKLEQYECFFNNNSEGQTQLPSTPLLKAKPYPRVTVSHFSCFLNNVYTLSEPYVTHAVHSKWHGKF